MATFNLLNHEILHIFQSTPLHSGDRTTVATAAKNLDFNPRHYIVATLFFCRHLWYPIFQSTPLHSGDYKGRNINLLNFYFHPRHYIVATAKTSKNELQYLYIFCNFNTKSSSFKGFYFIFLALHQQNNTFSGANPPGILCSLKIRTRKQR